MAVIDLSLLPAPQIVNVPDLETRLGSDIRRSAIYAALHVENVQRVELTSPLDDVLLDTFYIHQHKGTTSTVRRVMEPFGFLIRIIEWWQTGETPKTFRPDIGVQDQDITDETCLELECLIGDAKPCSRHLIGMPINLQTSGPYFVGATTYTGEEITIYLYTTKPLFPAAPFMRAVHVIDTMRVNL